MANTPNFKKSQVPQPPPGAGLPDTGGLPLKKNQFAMTPWTRQMLEGMGWKEGDPIPGDIGERIKAAMQAAQAEDVSKLHPMGEAPPPGSRVKIGKQANFEDLPPEHQEELRQAMADAKAHQEAMENSARARAEAQVPKTMNPDVREAAVNARTQEIERQDALAAQQAAQQAVEDPNMPEITIERGKGPDFRRNKPPEPPQAAPAPETQDSPPEPTPEALPAALQPPPGANVAGMSGIASFVTQGVPQPQKAAPEPKPEPEPEPEPEETGAGGDLPIHHCPRCLFNLSQTYAVEPTERDRTAFVATILGGGRFFKSFVLMGSRLTVSLRSLTAAETDLIFQQLRIDQLSGKILGDADYFARMNLYRLCCMVDRITDGEGKTVAHVPEIFSIPYDEPTIGEPQETRLVPMLKWFREEVCPSESLLHILARQHADFQRLIEALEAQTSEPSFW